MHSPDTTPTYNSVAEILSLADLPFSASELHGMLCAHICNNAHKEPFFIQHLLASVKDQETHLQVIFALENYTAERLQHFDFRFELLLPNDDQPLQIRAQAFSEWCAGFTAHFKPNAIEKDKLEEEEWEALMHIKEFSKLDYEQIEIKEEDEKAFFEITEYAKFALLRIGHTLISPETNPKH